LSILVQQGRLSTLIREWLAYRKHHAASWRGLLAMTLGPWTPERLWAWAAAKRGRKHSAPHAQGMVRLENGSVRESLIHARRTGQPRSGVPLRQVGSAARFRIMSWADNGLFYHYVRARYGIEIRDPLGSKRLVELSLRLGPEHFYRDGQVRRLSINLLRGRVPDAVIAERRRGAQGTNWAASARLALDEMKREIPLIKADPELADMLDVPELERKLDQWPARGWGDDDVDATYRASMTVALCAARFARRVRERDCGAQTR
jgi:asparagine synthase (glutamine-hydrolysing)